MVTCGLLVRLVAKAGMDKDMEDFLISAVPLVNDEPGTIAWFAIRFGRSEYGIFDVFPDVAARDAHIGGKVAKALYANADRLFAEPPKVQKLDVLAEKLPAGAHEPVKRAILLTVKAKAGHEDELGKFLQGAQPLVQEEPGTLAWFAIRLDDDHYGVFDVFPDNAARFAHLAGHVPRELAKHAQTLLGSMPDLELLNVLAEKL